MRVEWLFLRWLVVIGLIALGVSYAKSWRLSRPHTAYETIPLVRGERSSGMPVRGVMVDPQERSIYAVVGGPTDSSQPADFFILWKGKNGETFSAAFPKGESGAAGLWKVTSDGQLRQLHDFQAADVSSLATIDRTRTSKAEATLHAIVSNLSGQPESVSRR
jgi:hypothetical protein